MMQEYFSELQKSLDGIPPEEIINYDETNITDDPGVKRVFGRRGSKRVYRMMGSSKSSISVMFCGTASGELLPPYVVYGASHVYDTSRQGGPKGALYGCSKTSWFNEIIFSDWFEGIILPYVKKLPKEVPKVVIGDNLCSHISINVLQKCREHNIKFILLPPNSTHLCQPVDVAYFRPLKAE
ncbi:MFS-type transporter clz9-like [Schistocerca piceifrons]|uniref:MFS-type transporter clz9-like n=1 Tax=Schistocerca piceifrons TaxID=274613 RepID=UPI001F5F5ECF|nr:MFS-type transporter clz9-like [Schistocerca piceifrons]